MDPAKQQNTNPMATPPKALEEMITPPPPPRPASPISHSGEDLPSAPPTPAVATLESVVNVIGRNGPVSKIKKTKSRFFKFLLGGLGALVLVGGLGAGLWQVKQNQRIRPSLATGPGYTNVCGSGIGDGPYSCQASCNKDSGECNSSNSGGGDSVVKFVCSGSQTECGGNGATPESESWGTSQNVKDVSCGKTAQVDVFTIKCRQDDGSWLPTCPPFDGYLVYYGGDCTSPTATPTTAAGDFKCKDKRAFRGTLDNRGNRINDGGNIRHGASFVYSIRVENTTPEQKDGEIRDVLPEFLTYEAGEPGCSFDESTRRVTCTVNNVTENQTKEKAFQVRVADSAPLGTFKNTARLAGQNSSCDLDLNIVEAPTSDLQCVAKTAWGDADKTVQIASGSNVAREKIFYYGIEAKNFGTVAADGRIEDTLPSQVVFQGFVNNADNSCTNTDNNITCTISGLAAGQSVSKLIKVKVADTADAGPFTNPASVIPTLGDPTGCSLPLTVQISNPVVACQQLKILRGTPLTEISAKDIRLGDTITFRGFATATNATLTKIKFTLTKNGQAQTPVEKTATLISGVYQADYEVSIDQATSYLMKTEPVTP